MKWNWRLALQLGGIVTLFWLIEWSTYLVDWLFPPKWPLIVGGVEY
jgi:hypothetical protein